MLGFVTVANAGGYVIGSSSGAGSSAGLSNLCLTLDDPSSSSAAWSCQVGTASGGLGWVSGVVGNSLAVQAANLGSLAGAQSIVIGTQATSATGASSIAIGAGATTASVSNGVALGTGATVGVAGGVALGQGAVANTAAGLDGYVPTGASSANAIAATKSTLAAVSVGDAASGQFRQINGVAAGTADSDAANVAQVKAVTASVSNLSDRSVMYDGAVGSAKDTVTLAGSTGTTLTNVKAGAVSAASSDAVNGAQLYSTNQAVAALGSDALKWNSSLGAYDASHGSGSAQKISNVAAGTLDTDAANVGQVNAVSAGVANLSDRAVLYDGVAGDPKTTITLAGSGGTLLTNVTAGAVSAASSDAVNGSQLFGVSRSAATVFGGGASVASDGTLIAPTYRVDHANYNNVGDAIGAVDTKLSSLNTTLSNVVGSTPYVQVNATGPVSRATGTDSIAIGSSAQGAAANSTAIGQGASANNAGDVALGSGSTTAAAVQTSTMTINGTTYAVAGTATSTVSVGAVGAERTITNLAAGQVNATSTDAVNGSQLYATNQALSSAVGSIGVLGRTAVQYDTDTSGNKLNSITLAGGDANAPVVISNVAAGVASKDAVNVAQMKTGLSETLASANTYTDSKTSYAISTANTYTDTKSQQTLTQANAYTDQKFASLNSQIATARTEARQAAAVGLAAGSLRYDDRPGKVSAAVGAGAWGGESAFAMGLGYTTPDQRMRMNISGSSAGGDWGAAGGLSLTLN
ncbi:YadA-like family protein [Roseixanthobacter glucoisosaccharinicivorans]|uniref:YadA-like family protein n=1 Tax=Roseixanthobacter glucoisosaccharinicivorans TaxID=3119923 RepID=UPI003726A93F